MRINRHEFLVWASRLPNIKYPGGESQMDAGQTAWSIGARWVPLPIFKVRRHGPGRRGDLPKVMR